MNYLGLSPDDVGLDDLGDKLKNKVPACHLKYLTDLNQYLTNPNGGDLDQLLFMADVVLDYAWEQLNTNLWVFVDDHLRLLYGYGTLYKTILVYLKSKSLDRVVKLCDLGLLMTGHLLEKKFNSIIRHVREESRKTVAVKHSGQDDQESSLPKVPRVETWSPVISDQHALTIEDSPSIERFREEYLKKQVPCIIRNQMNHWPALKKWRFVSCFGTSSSQLVYSIELVHFMLQVWTI